MSEGEKAPPAPGLRLVSGEQLGKRLALPPRKDGLIITPLLEEGQVSSTTVDLRLGTEFLVSLRTRTPYVDTRPEGGQESMAPFFERTYRDFGDPFVLYPMHFVLGCTFEYVRMPNDLCAEMHVRSSLGRAGVGIRGFVQPGYMGVLTLELANDSGNTLVLYPGMRAVQLYFFEIETEAGAEYVRTEAAKYLGGTGPQLSLIRSEKEWSVLDRMRRPETPRAQSGRPPEDKPS